jgi:hypothetical protein
MSWKGYRPQRIMRYDTSFFCIPGKMIVVIAYSCLSSNFLKTTEPTLTIRESEMFGMVMYLICLDQLAKIGHHVLAFEKGEFLDIWY